MIDIDFKDINKLISKLKCTTINVQKAKQTAIRQVASETKSNWAELIGQEINLPLNTIKRAMYSRANANGFSVSVRNKRLPFYTSLIGGIPLARFQPEQDSTGTAVLIKKSRGSQHIKHAFIARMKTGHVGVFSRYSSSGALLPGSGKRAPIRQLYTSSITDIASNHLSTVQQVAVEQFTSTVTAELKKGC